MLFSDGWVKSFLLLVGKMGLDNKRFLFLERGWVRFF